MVPSIRNEDGGGGGGEAKDEVVLAGFGYKQELKRDFRAVDLFGLSFSLIGLIPSMSSVLVYAIPNGGPVAMVWGWAVSSVFLVFIALAVAELGSSMPTTGGVYYWTYRLCSPGSRNLASWLVGYMNSIAYICGIAGVDWACAVQIFAAVSIGSDLTFVPTTAQTYGVFMAILVSNCVLVSLETKAIAMMHTLFTYVNIMHGFPLLALVFIIGIPAATPAEFKNDANSPLEISKTVRGLAGVYRWPDGFAFILSFLAPLWTIGGFDSTVHISEEARNARTAVPWAMLCSVVTSCALGFVVNIVLTFHMGKDLAGILGSPVGQPMATILLNSFGKGGTLAIWSIIIVAQYMIGISLVTVCSRQNFAFSRDGAFPFSRYIYAVNARLGSPVYSVWVSGLLAALVCLLAFAGPTAVGALFSLPVVAQYVAISIPVVARFVGGQTFVPGPFYLGRLSAPVAAVAVGWMGFATVVMLFPVTPQTDAQEMNYSVVVLGGVIVFALTYYYFPRYGGVHWFEGPVVTLERGDDVVHEGRWAETDSKDDKESGEEKVGSKSEATA
ncbi:APC amino acid permease [Amylostereum chailletii]|nr:APC amino acid permease [Amylostereum chailletii]